MKIEIRMAIVALVVALCLGLAGCAGQPAASAQGAAPTCPPCPTCAPAASAKVEPLPTYTLYPTYTPYPTAAKPTEQSQQPTAAPAAKAAIGKIGERIEAGGIALTIGKVSRTNKAGILTAKEGMEYVVIEALIENASRDETTPYNPMYFKLKDGEGFEYNSAMLAPDPSLKSGELAKGDKARGNVAFEVTKGASGLIVSYEPLVILGGYEPIRIDLGE